MKLLASLAMANPYHNSNEDSLSDRDLIDFMRRAGASTTGELVEYCGVTATAVRQRLHRLMEQGLVTREAESAGRGRPTHRYSLTEAGVQSAGTNYTDLVEVLWSEIRAVEDPDVRHGLLKRIVGRLAERYRSQVPGDGLQQRMESVVAMMQQRDVPFEVTVSADSQLPVLTALACPYPDLAAQDRGICSMENMLLTEILGEGVRLSGCRLDGENCCTFEARASASPTL